MELLLRLLERRFVLGIAVVLAAIWAQGRWGDRALEKVDMMRRPPAEASSPLAAEITKDLDAKESAKVRGLHRAVSAEIAAAEASGLNVANLQRVADSALALDTPGYRPQAIEKLNKLRMAVPRRKEAFRPAAADEMSPDAFDTPRKIRADRR